MKKITLAYVLLFSCADLNAELFCEVLDDNKHKNLSIIPLDQLKGGTVEDSIKLGKVLTDAIFGEFKADSVLTVKTSSTTYYSIIENKKKKIPAGEEIYPCSKFESDKTTTYVCKSETESSKWQINLRLLKDNMTMNVEKRLWDTDPVTGGNFTGEFNAICSSSKAN